MAWQANGPFYKEKEILFLCLQGPRDVPSLSTQPEELSLETLLWLPGPGAEPEHALGIVDVC